MPTTRRRFLSSVAAAPFLAAAAPERLPIRKAVEFNMLPRALGVREKFQLAKEAGFEAIECPTTPEAAKAEEMLAASKEVGLPIHSVMNQAHWNSPLSSADPAVVETGSRDSRTVRLLVSSFILRMDILISNIMQKTEKSQGPANAMSECTSSGPDGFCRSR